MAQKYRVVVLLPPDNIPNRIIRKRSLTREQADQLARILNQSRRDKTMHLAIVEPDADD